MGQFDLTDDHRIVPRDVIKQAVDRGFAAIDVSQESGGINLGRGEGALVMEAMACGCSSTSAFISIHNIAAWMIDRSGSQEVKGEYLRGLRVRSIPEGTNQVMRTMIGGEPSRP